MHESDYRGLLRRTLIITAVCIVAVLICYFWIDRPVAFFVYGHHINKIEVFRWFTYPPPEVQNWSALVLTILMVRRARSEEHTSELQSQSNLVCRLLLE